MLAGHSDRVTSVAATPDGRYAVSGSVDRTLRIWDLQTGASSTTFHGDTPFLSIAITPDSQTIVAGDVEGRIHFLRPVGLP